MKILNIVPSYKPAYVYGGPVESIARLCEVLAQAGDEITVYTTTANGKTELDVQPGKEYIIDGVKVFYFKRETKDPLHFSFALLQNLYQHCRQFDVVHIHSWWNIPAMLGAFICNMRKVKTVFSPRGMLSDYIINNSNSRIKQFVHSTAGVSLLRSMTLHATSEAELAECTQVIPGWKGAVVPNIVALPELNIQKTKNDVFTLLFLSRIHPKKGIELLMEAVSKLGNEVCVKIAGIGDENYINELKAKAQELEIAGKLKWLGWKNRDEKFEVLMQADLFVLTSYNENFANVVIEALHVGTPVLLTDGVGLSDFVEKNDLGWVTTTEAGAIKSSLEKAISDKEKRNKIIAVAPAIIKQNFSADTLIPKYKLLYSS
jgi:glycosyltransferase involved in cell wall biosynthesis